LSHMFKGKKITRIILVKYLPSNLEFDNASSSGRS
jgi:hypothetical protein